jgi:hypothetical protein
MTTSKMQFNLFITKNYYSTTSVLCNEIFYFLHLEKPKLENIIAR